MADCDGFALSLISIICLVSLSGGELFERITAEGYTMSEAEVINYMRQICEAVKHMHEKNIIHLGKTLIFLMTFLRRVQVKSWTNLSATEGIILTV